MDLTKYQQLISSYLAGGMRELWAYNSLKFYYLQSTSYRLRSSSFLYFPSTYFRNSDCKFLLFFIRRQMFLPTTTSGLRAIYSNFLYYFLHVLHIVDRSLAIPSSTCSYLLYSPLIFCLPTLCFYPTLFLIFQSSQAIFFYSITLFLVFTILLLPSIFISQFCLRNLLLQLCYLLFIYHLCKNPFQFSLMWYHHLFLALLILIYSLNLSVQGLQCAMTAIVTFTDCVNFCLNKYGSEPESQRKYYNRFNGNCEKAVTCSSTKYSPYQNRCYGQFESFVFGNIRISTPQIAQSISVVIVHGSDSGCFPGYFSSNKRTQVGVQLYQQYRCDIPIGGDPENYPRSHGQYFFYKLSLGEQKGAVFAFCQGEQVLDIPSVGFLIIESCFMISLLHFHMKKIWKKIRKLRKKIWKQNQRMI